MILEKITIANFRSFIGEQVFEFPREPGFYFMQGVNQVEPRLGGNGAGKSTIWDALTWCLFGKTSRGLKAGDVCNWDARKGTKVVLSIYDGVQGIGYEVTRTWGPIKWTLRSWDISGARGDFDDTTDLGKDQSNPILAMLKLEFSPFLNTILMAQGQPMFLDMRSDRQAELFSDVLGLDRWLDYATLASKKASAQDSISRVLEGKLAGLRGQLEALGRNDHRGSADRWEADRDARIADQEAKHAKLIADLKRNKDLLEGLTESRTNQRALVAQLEGPLVDLKAERDRVSAEVRDHTQRLGDLQRDLGTIDEQLENLTTGTCPTCKQSISSRDRDCQAHISSLRQSWRKQKTAWDHTNDTIKIGERNLRELDKEIDEKEYKLIDERARLDGIISDIAHHDRQAGNINKELDRIEDQTAEIEAETNPYASLQEQNRKDGDRLQQELEDVRSQLDASNHRYSICSFWVRGFKELRLNLIAEALNELEIEVNSSVAELGLTDWEIRFQVDRETKGGSIQRGFSVFVGSPHNEGLVPWEAWSGGESQRLRLAGTMGLANLIRNRSGTELDLEVWDEPTQGLSPQGVQDLLESLAVRAKTEHRMIWLVDHRTYDFGGFSGGAMVVKTKDGSQLQPMIKEEGE
jgi:DNA repair exonuclease SbcCD ATPase subunit